MTTREELRRIKLKKLFKQWAIFSLAIVMAIVFGTFAADHLLKAEEASQVMDSVEEDLGQKQTTEMTIVIPAREDTEPIDSYAVTEIEEEETPLANIELEEPDCNTHTILLIITGIVLVLGAFDVYRGRQNIARLESRLEFARADR